MWVIFPKKSLLCVLCRMENHGLPCPPFMATSFLLSHSLESPLAPNRTVHHSSFNVQPCHSVCIQRRDLSNDADFLKQNRILVLL